MRLSRKELSCLLAFEADLLRKTHQRPGERPLSSQLMIQISNYIVDHAKPNFSKPQQDDSGCLS